MVHPAGFYSPPHQASTFHGDTDNWVTKEEGIKQFSKVLIQKQEGLRWQLL